MTFLTHNILKMEEQNRIKNNYKSYKEHESSESHLKLPEKELLNIRNEENSDSEVFLSSLIKPSKFNKKNQKPNHDESTNEEKYSFLKIDNDEMNEVFKENIQTNTQKTFTSNLQQRKRRFWDETEDNLLRMLVKKFGDNSWRKVSNFMSRRNPKQCSERWFNHLAPDINRTEFTVEEDLMIYYFYFTNGGKWKDLEKQLPHRTTLSLKNRFNSSIKKRLCKEYCCSPDEIEAAAGLCKLWYSLGKFENDAQ
ncbi:hypothetical protein EDEG_02421 [Edhazardia aedis USNM 41457]|uniref:Myb-like DNA-binding domain containing protein n=1 Tax=Edhazardia aedis (strain USNM 41457) TaxID=1003232 RepID=J9D5Z6_EDHAE|nr:hypothetical protein EDEG_02421 [Edhazardia aedis USNM 41457]|eukprot:EJW03206.1 hypothetical protein EDEG_02421 [Edhazardia aedis USNM 41457]